MSDQTLEACSTNSKNDKRFHRHRMDDTRLTRDPSFIYPAALRNSTIYLLVKVLNFTESLNEAHRHVSLKLRCKE